MLRVTAWCVGLFGAGAAISRMFPSPWAQPVVLLALGMAFLFVSRTVARPRRAEVVTELSRRAGPKAEPAAARVPVEQSA